MLPFLMHMDAADDHVREHLRAQYGRHRDAASPRSASPERSPARSSCRSSSASPSDAANQSAPPRICGTRRQRPRVRAARRRRHRVRASSRGTTARPHRHDAARAGTSTRACCCMRWAFLPARPDARTSRRTTRRTRSRSAARRLAGPDARAGRPRLSEMLETTRASSRATAATTAGGSALRAGLAGGSRGACAAIGDVAELPQSITYCTTDPSCADDAILGRERAE